MQPPTDAQVGAVFAALADPIRRGFIGRLAQGEASISELADSVDISMPAVSRHVRLLADAGLVEREKRGRTTFLRLGVHRLRAAESWLAETRSFWEGGLDRLAAHLEEDVK